MSRATRAAKIRLQEGLGPKKLIGFEEKCQPGIVYDVPRIWTERDLAWALRHGFELVQAETRTTKTTEGSAASGSSSSSEDEKQEQGAEKPLNDAEKSRQESGSGKETTSGVVEPIPPSSHVEHPAPTTRAPRSGRRSGSRE